jgi:ribosomal protein S18 acetylase RimI-like enzyme
MSEILIREASEADLPDVLRLYAQPDLDNGKTLPLDQAERVFDLMKRYPDYRVYVSAIDKNIVGTFALLIIHNLAHLGDPSAVVEEVAVAPEWQERGVGKMMMRYALKMAAGKGCYKVVLSSNLKREGAHAFYESLGFERHGYSFRISLKQK